LDGCEEVVVALFVSCGHGSEVLEFVEEALDGVAPAVDHGLNGNVDPVGHGADIARAFANYGLSLKKASVGVAVQLAI
jgi:hypothetical protein